MFLTRTRPVPSEEPEPVAMLRGVIKRMPTIESVGSRELASLRLPHLPAAPAAATALAPCQSQHPSPRPCAPQRT
jgi:hypothetical protein